MFALFPEFGARIRSQDLWPFLISETGLKFLIWTQSEIHPGNLANRPRSTRLMWRGPLLANPDSFFSALIQNFLCILLQPFEKRINGRRDRIWFQNLYYYMRNLCNLIGLEQWYFSLIWNTLLHEMFVTCLFRDFDVHIRVLLGLFMQLCKFTVTVSWDPLVSLRRKLLTTNLRPVYMEVGDPRHVR